MADLFDYLAWRGDLPLDRVPFGPVDGLLVSALAYIRFDGLAPEDFGHGPSLGEAASAFFALPEAERQRRLRNPLDLELLRAMGESARFGPLGLRACRSRWDPAEETQFAALSLLLPKKGGAIAAFRGTDGTLVGWKEDFNLGFLDATPGQRMARDYLADLARAAEGPLWLAGHSKGGNLAVYAAARSEAAVQARIQAVFNNDGPGFSENMLKEAGYRAVLARVQTFVPQSSVVGMLLEHEGGYTIVHSRQLGIWQHEPYSWELSGPDFVRMETVTEGSRRVDQTMKRWLSGLSREERGEFVDAVYALLQASDAGRLGELAQPKNAAAILRRFWQEPPETRQMILNTLERLARAAASVMRGGLPALAE